MSEFLEPARRIIIAKDILDHYKTDELSSNLEKLTDEKLCLVMDLANSDAEYDIVKRLVLQLSEN
jgi:hypothetical protein